MLVRFGLGNWKPTPLGLGTFLLGLSGRYTAELRIGVSSSCCLFSKFVSIGSTLRGTGGNVFILLSWNGSRELVALTGLAGSEGQTGSLEVVKAARGLGRIALGQSKLCTCSAFLTMELAMGGMSAKLEKRSPIWTVADDAMDEFRACRFLMDGGGLNVLLSKPSNRLLSLLVLLFSTGE